MAAREQHLVATVAVAYPITGHSHVNLIAGAYISTRFHVFSFVYRTHIARFTQFTFHVFIQSPPVCA